MLPRCPRCQVQAPDCICDAIPTLPTRTHILLIRHCKELNKASNTGRIAHLALPNSSLYDYGTPDVRFDPHVLDEPGTMLLFPDGPPATTALPSRLVVLDGTWGQARRMVQRLPALHHMPRFSLPPPPARLRMRQPHLSEGMATLEAIAWALHTIEGAHLSTPLLDLYDHMTKLALRSRGLEL